MKPASGTGRRGASAVAGVTFTPLAYLTLFALGLCFGSFLNVVIHRLPLGLSIVAPRRPARRAGIASGRSTTCRSSRGSPSAAAAGTAAGPIPLALPGGRAGAPALLVVALAVDLGPRAALAPALLFALALLAVAFIDWDHRIIPDEISLGGTVVGLFARGFTWPGVSEGLDRRARRRGSALAGRLGLPARDRRRRPGRRRRQAGAA